VVVGQDAASVGDVVADLERQGLRATAFVGDPATERDALVEMIAELFPTRPTPESPEPA
jgi:uncharacterized protein (UPF0218 family)